MLLLNIISLDYKLKKQNLGYYNQSIAKSQLDNFRKSLDDFIKNINILANDKLQREESVKLKIRDFLISTFYNKDQLDIHRNIDLAILNKEILTNKVDVIFELKTPQNNAEMISTNNLNKKAMWELVHYYMQERLKGNITIKHLIATNGLDWFVFDAREFEKLFYNNKAFYQKYIDWNNNTTVNNNVAMAYQIIEEYINISNDTIETVHFNINAINNEDEIIKLYKLLSPQHLLKLPFANDSNTLNTEFYNELLYILGLEEKNEGKYIINRATPANRQSASLLENTINQLKIYKNITDENELFEIALELCITWLNRILFLKLLEGQLIKFHNNDRQSYLFMNTDKIKGFDDLNELFFEVLALPEKNRSNDVREKYKNIPYLNSSLFEITNYENDYISIGNLKDRLELPLYKYTVLKDNHGRPLTGKLSTLNYLFRFLNSYDFSSDVNKTVQSDNRDIINAAVLGLIFEKINGYKDGSFFTPGYITEYMCRETIRQAVIDKFNEKYNWQCRNFIDLYNKIDEKHTDEANAVIDSLRICDPAVGSGHFLVSALNEIIAIKSELEILADDNGKRLKDVKIKVENDELVILYKNKFFEYKPGDDDSQRVQETIFKEKQKIIENCLFGVDINSKSVQITRLRLWIELLKNAYYKAPDYKELETLPNIDINIKCGDSLISRFGLDSDLKQALRNSRYSIDAYKIAIVSYHQTKSKKEKTEILKLINEIKENFKIEISQNHPLNKKLVDLKSKLFEMTQKPLFEYTDNEKINWEKDVNKIKNEIDKIESELNYIKNGEIYKNAFEWRYEFPEVLDDNGDYVGFDAVIGNPPYIQLQKAYNDTMKYADLYKNMNYETFDRTGDIYCLFYERGIQIAKDNGILCYISSNKWMRAGYGEKLRSFFLKYNPLLLLDLGPGIFESATVDTCIMILQKNDKSMSKQYSLKAVTITKERNLPLDIDEQVKGKSVTLSKLTKDAWFIGSEAEQKLKEKIEHIGKPLKDWDVKIYRGVLTGLNEAFIIDNTKRQEILDNCKDEDERRRTENIIKPILRGRDIKRYYYEWAGLWVIVIPAGWTNEKRKNEAPEFFIECQFPSLIKYLKNFETKAKKRDDQGDYWWELRACAYYPEFEKEKVVYGQFQDNAEYAIAGKGIFLSSNEYMIGGNYNKNYFLAILNSKLIQWYLRNITGVMGEKLKIGQKSNFIKIPIPTIDISNQPIVSQIESLVDKILAAKKENHAADTSEWEKEIDKLVYQLYKLEPEEIEIIERRQ
jgi:adenine-specific DNA-methyltransferase